jgi:hypothetical protein
MVNRSAGETRGAGAVGLRFTLAAEAKSRAAGERKSMAVAYEHEPTELRLADAIATAALAPEKEERSARGAEVGVGRFGSDEVGAGDARAAAAAEAERAVEPARGLAMVARGLGMVGCRTSWSSNWVRLESGAMVFMKEDD